MFLNNVELFVTPVVAANSKYLFTSRVLTLGRSAPPASPLAM